jgi:glycosyltransferase involved in cell wall biosynthesis
MRILFIHSTPVPPALDPRANRFALLSPRLEGDVLQPIWFRTPGEVEAALGPGSYPVHTVGNFRFHWFLIRHRGLRLKLPQLWFYVSEGLRLHRQQKYECIVCYAHQLTGLCGVFLKLLTRAKLIIEIVTSPSLAYVTRHSKVSLRDRLMRLSSDICLHISLWSCDRVHLLSRELLAPYPLLRRVPASIFPEFVPVSVVPRAAEAEDETYVLLVGAPWRIKGVDLLIAAFRRLAPEFPAVKLKLLGWFPDRERLEALAGGSPQIEILKPRPNPEVLQIISRAAVFALPSRCEGAPVVVLEAMAAGVPVVASDVGGIPSLVREGESGFLVPVENVDVLEARLRQLLSDRDLRKRMGARGYEIAHSEFNETLYVEKFARMVADAVQGSERA